MWCRRPLITVLLLIALVAVCPTPTLAKGGGGHSGGGHSSGGGHGCAHGGHAGAGPHGSYGSGGRLSSWTSSSGASHHTGGFGYGNPAYGNSAYVSFDPVWNNSLPLPVPWPPAADGSDPTHPNEMPSGSPHGIGTPESAAEFIEKGDQAFKAGDYPGAVHEWRHAALEDPQNGVLMMKLGQALFATGQFREAAFAIQMGMYRLPGANWGDIVSHYSQLYGPTQDFTNQLRTLEEAIRIHDEDPALRFVAGFEFGYLGFLEQSISHLDVAVMYASHDAMTDLLSNEMRIRLAKSAHPQIKGDHPHASPSKFQQRH